MWIDDTLIAKAKSKLVANIWRPECSMVVLGRSNKASEEVHVERCNELGVEILQRYGGGGTVLLYPGCLVVSVGAWVDSPYDNDRYFKLLNQSIINTINGRLNCALGQKGYSDIVHGTKKLAGTSLFRSRHYLLYQASVILTLDIGAINTCLKHPSKEPDYRKNRGHAEFLTGLSELDPSKSDDFWLEEFERSYETHLHALINSHLREPQWEHIPHLRKRAGLLV